MRCKPEWAVPERLFAYQQFGIQPDIMTLAKGLRRRYPHWSLSWPPTRSLKLLNQELTPQPLAVTPLPVLRLKVLELLIEGGKA